MMFGDAKNKRLLMTADCVGGVWDFSLELAGALSRRGVSILLAVLGEPSGEKIAAAGEIPRLELASAPFRLEWMEDGLADQDAACDWIFDLCREFRPRAAHLNTYAQAGMELGVPKILTAHSCVHSWWRGVKGSSPPPEYDAYGQLVRRALVGADRVVYPTMSLARTMISIHGKPANSAVVANGRDPSVFRPSNKRPLVLSAGRLWDEAKNIRTLEMVAPCLEWPVFIAGEHRDHNGNGAPPENVEYLGFINREEMARMLGMASIYAHPARYEPFGLCVLEAALSGCALVLGDIPTLRELWGGAALFVPPNEPEALHRSLDWLIRNEESRNMLARRALRRARAYNTESMCANYLQLYGEKGAERRTRRFRPV